MLGAPFRLPEGYSVEHDSYGGGWKYNLDVYYTDPATNKRIRLGSARADARYKLRTRVRALIKSHQFTLQGRV